MFIMTKIKDTKLNNSHGRLRFIRSISGLTRNEIEEKYGLPEITLRKWETGNITLSKKGIIRCLDVYRQEDIICSEDWIINGTGPRPYLTIEFKESKNITDDILNFFRTKYQNCMTYKITNKDMLPLYKPGDYVIGDVYRGDIKDLNDKDCIILLSSEKIIFKKLFYSEDKQISLISTNPTATKTPIIVNPSIKYLAPVLWHKIRF